ncbi:MAG: N-acetyl-gamma-glutamyl-phosphate reductase [Bacteroidetes bacterium]|nr:N-acetyl-gamma-glutamyl-phosphate reductase [Bacteroidota bacterium]
MKIKVGIIGGAGYTGGELIRILLNHPNVELVFVHSNSNAGNKIWHVHTDLLGETELEFTNKISFEAELLFLCSGHHKAEAFFAENTIPEHIAIIDLSQDFRHRNKSEIQGRKFIYGLPELNRDKISKSRNIANPGCFATGVQLALLPFANAGILPNEIHVNATTGSTGAGQAPSDTTHFSWRDNNTSVYKAFTHQHLTEINESLCSLQSNFDGKINFIPQRGNFSRGIFASVYFKCSLTREEILELFNFYYKTHPFIRISNQPIDLKQVVNTNRCFIAIEKHDDYTFITSAVDNLLKGASGQAVQNMNLMFGFDETTGLKLKPSAF